MKYLIVLLLALLMVVAQATQQQEEQIENVEFSLNDFKDFMIGFAEGIDISLGGDPAKCIEDSKASFTDFSDAFSKLDSGISHKSISETKDGLKDFGRGLLEIPKILKYCKVKKFVDDIENLAKGLSAGDAGVIKVIIKEIINILSRHHDLTDDFKGMISNYKAHSYTNTGKDAGKIVGILLND